MAEITEDTLRAISSIFDGDTEDIYCYKSGSAIFKFFNRYFGYHDVYSFRESYPSRWVIVSQKLAEIANQNKLSRFFDIVLSIEFLGEENPDLSNDKLKEKSVSAQQIFNRILRGCGLEILFEDGHFKIDLIQNDLVLLGEGGFAKCYLRHSDNKVVKKLKENFYSDAGVVSRFKREYKITKELQDVPGIIKVFDLDEHNLAYTMELAEQDLYHYVLNNPDLTTDMRTTICFQILSTMQKVHEQNVTHRDLTPNNIFLISGQFKIADFGLGKNYEDSESHKTTATYGFGTWQYCDPRQLKSLGDGGDKEADIYALGRIINFVMTSDPENLDHIYRQVTEKATTPNLAFRFRTPKQLLDEIVEINQCIKDKEYQKKIDEEIQTGMFSPEICRYIQTLPVASLFQKIQNPVFLGMLEKTLNSGLDDTYVINCLLGIGTTIDESERVPFPQFDPPGYLALFILNNHFSTPVNEAAIDLLNRPLNANRFGIREKTDGFLKAHPEFPTALAKKIN